MKRAQGLLISFVILATSGQVLATGKGGRPDNVPDDYVQAPGGGCYFHPSCVFELARGETLDAQNMERVDVQGKRTKLTCAYPSYYADGRQRTEKLQGFAPGRFDAAVYASLGSDQLISWFSADWTVPSPPRRFSNQFFGLWIGLQPRDSSYVIQPVLAWNENERGNYWTMAVWYVSGSNVLAKSSDVQVWPGQRISGYLYQNNGYNYFYGYNVDGAYVDGLYTILPTDLYPVWAMGGMLESYNLYTCDELPPEYGELFSNESVYVWGTPRTMPWQMQYASDIPYCNFAASWGSGSQVDIYWNSYM